MAAYFELGHIPRRVVVGRSLHKAELRFVGSQVIVEVERKLDYR